jgi:hypothetical protein
MISFFVSINHIFRFIAFSVMIPFTRHGKPAVIRRILPGRVIFR